MADLKDKWSTFGKGIGHAFANLGKSLGTTAKVVAGNEPETNENGESTLKESWKKTGKGFGHAGTSLGQAFKSTAERVFDSETDNNEEKHDSNDDNVVNNQEIIQIECKENGD